MRVEDLETTPPQAADHARSRKVRDGTGETFRGDPDDPGELPGVWSKGGLPYFEEPALPHPALYFQEYLTIGALASAAHSWVDPSYIFTFRYPRTSERTNHQPEPSRPVSQ